MVFSPIRILLLLSLLNICSGILVPLFVYKDTIKNLVNFGFPEAQINPLNTRANRLRANYCNTTKTTVAKLDSSKVARCWVPANTELIKCQEEVFYGLSLSNIRNYVCNADQAKMMQVTQQVTECVKKAKQTIQEQYNPTSNVKPTVVIILGTDQQRDQTDSDRQGATEYYQVPDFTSVSSKEELIDKLGQTLTCYENILK